MKRALLALAIVMATRSPAWATWSVIVVDNTHRNQTAHVAYIVIANKDDVTAGSRPFSTVPTVALPDAKP
jgi:hypothetical protein